MKERDLSPTEFTPQVPAIASTGLGQTEEPRNPSGSPMGAGAHGLGTSSTAYPSALAGSWNENRVDRIQISALIWELSISMSSPTVALSLSQGSTH